MDFEWTSDIPRDVEAGDRIKLVNMPDDPHPLEAGTEGTVKSVDKRIGVIGVEWDNGSRLNLVIGVDLFDVLNEEASDKAIINKSMPKPTLKGKNISPLRKNFTGTFKKALTKGKVKDIKVESEKLVGGKADDMTPQDIADKHKVELVVIQKELEMGIEIEMEHTDSPMKAKEVVMDHLFEFPDYYSNKEHGLKVSEKGLEKVHENTILENFFGNMFGGKKDPDEQYDTMKFVKDLKKVTNSIKTGTFQHKETIQNMLEKFREKYSEHSMIDTVMKSLYHEFDQIGGEIEETTSAGGMGAGYQYSGKLESRIIKVSDLLEATTTTNSGDYDVESKSPFDSNKDGWFWNDKPWFEGGKIVDKVAQLDNNWKDELLTVKMTKEELIKTVNLLETKTIEEEELDETMTASSSGSFEGPMFAAKDDGNWNMGKKPIWKGGKIVQKVKNSGVLSEINKIKWVKDGTYVKLKDSCVKYRNQPWCSSGDADKPLILSKTTSDNITEVSKKLGISEKEVEKFVIKKLTR